LNTKTKRGALFAAALLTIGAASLVSPVVPAAQAANGDVVLSIDFSGLSPDAEVAAAQATATTDFTKAEFALGTQYGLNTMYDEGRYIIASNPADVHVAWADYGAVDNPKLILNGFTSANSNVFTVTTQGEVCTTPGSSITFAFSAKMANILPLAYASDGGAAITVYINGESIGSEVALTNDPTNVVEILGSAPAAADGTLVISVVNNSTVLVGNDFSLDDIVVEQVGDCAPPACVPTTEGVWHNYTGKYSGGNLIPPPLDDPKWHALPAQPGGQHDLAVRGFNKPYNPGADKGKGDWFVWKDLGVVCPEV
jgi:hypothetical protein